jgi:hypothetical protein
LKLFIEITIVINSNCVPNALLKLIQAYSMCCGSNILPESFEYIKAHNVIKSRHKESRLLTMREFGETLSLPQSLNGVESVAALGKFIIFLNVELAKERAKGLLGGRSAGGLPFRLSGLHKRGGAVGARGSAGARVDTFECFMQAA